MAGEKPPTALDHHGNETHVTVRQLLRPCLIAMAVSGCYTYDADEIKTGNQTNNGKSYRLFGAVYRLVYFLICFGACGKALAAFTTIYPDLYL